MLQLMIFKNEAEAVQSTSYWMKENTAHHGEAHMSMLFNKFISFYLRILGRRAPAPSPQPPEKKCQTEKMSNMFKRMANVVQEQFVYLVEDINACYR